MVGYDDYYPYGLQMSGRSLVASEDGRYKFTGKERDASEGLDYFGARYYDSWNARWLQVDPLTAKYPEWSPYNYTLNNPLNFIDPKGSASYYLDGVAVPQEFGQQMMGEYRNEELFGGEEKQNNNKQSDNNNQLDKVFSEINNISSVMGTFAGLGEYSNVIDDSWRGANLSWYSLDWGGNQWTGARADVLEEAGIYRVAGRGFFALSTGISSYQGAKAYLKGDIDLAIHKGLDIAMNVFGTFGGPVGLGIGLWYFLMPLDANIGTHTPSYFFMPDHTAAVPKINF